MNLPNFDTADADQACCDPDNPSNPRGVSEMTSQQTVLELRNGATIQEARVLVTMFDNLPAYNRAVYAARRAISEARKDGYATTRWAEVLLDMATVETRRIAAKAVAS